MPLNKAAYLSAVRASLFNGRMGPKQAEGQNLIIAEWGERDHRQLAYVLATAMHETAHTMQPIHERGKRSYFEKYEPGTKIGKALGNTRNGDGFRYRGRGFAQLTGRLNYAKMGKRLGVDLEGSPDLALEPKIAVQCLIVGMTEGMFTGKKLSSYVNSTRADYVNARRVVNGTDRAGLIAGYAEKFEAALGASTAPVSRPKPAEAVPVPAPEYDRSAVRDVQQRLLNHGYVNVGGVDGLVGDMTRSAVRDFRAANGLPEGDHIDDALIAALKRPDAVRPVISPERADATLSELRDKGSVIADSAKKTGKGAIATVVAGVGAVASQIVESAGGLMNLGPALDPFRWLFQEYGIWIFGSIVAGLGGFFWWQAKRAGEARVRDHVTGNTAVIKLPDQV